MSSSKLKHKSGVQKDTRIRTYPDNIPKGDQGQKVRATHQRVQFVRNNMDMSISELADRTKLGQPIIRTIKIAEKNDNWKVRKNAWKGKFDELSGEMKEWLRNHEKGQSWRKYAERFNKSFNNRELTPLDVQTIRKYHERLKDPAKL